MCICRRLIEEQMPTNDIFFSLITFSPVAETKRQSDGVINYCYK